MPDQHQQDFEGLRRQRHRLSFSEQDSLDRIDKERPELIAMLDWFALRSFHKISEIFSPGLKTFRPLAEYTCPERDSFTTCHVTKFR